VYIHKDFLVCNYKDKAFSYKLLAKNPEELFSDIYKLFKNKLQMFSRDDILQKQDEIDGLNKKIVYNSWGDIKRKNIKDTLIENFVLDMKNKYSITYKHTRDLLNIINIGLIFKYITYKDIIMAEGKITDISCISFDSDSIFKYTRDIFVHSDIKPSPPIVFKTDTSISKEWDRYVSFYKKLYSR
jgi:hypothetical protein